MTILKCSTSLHKTGYSSIVKFTIVNLLLTLALTASYLPLFVFDCNFDLTNSIKNQFSLV